MSRRVIAAAFTVVLAALMIPSAHAQDQGYNPYAGPAMFPGASQQAAYYQSGPTGPAPTPIDANLNQAPTQVPAPQAGYVRLGAPMYPSPRPNIPIWTGSTVITNQAFAPQEMLYPHTYRSIYPPFYHRVKGGWIVTPFGVRSHEKWELQGTMVQVKYRSSYPGLLSGKAWCPPATSYNHGAWR